MPRLREYIGLSIRANRSPVCVPCRWFLPTAKRFAGGTTKGLGVTAEHDYVGSEGDPDLCVHGPSHRRKHLRKDALALGNKYGGPDKHEIKYFRNGVETECSGELIRWLNGDQYLEGSEIERAITIGRRALDAEIAEKERLNEHN
jgi:hypothetical protein